MTKNIVRLLSFLSFLFVAISAHAQTCGFPSTGPYGQTNYNPSCTGGGTYGNYSIGRVTFWCYDSNNGNATYAGPDYSSVTGYGQIHYWSFCSAIPYECDARMYSNSTTATSPTDYNRFYNYAFDKIYNGSICTEPGTWRQDFWQCQGLACAGGGGGGGGCGPCPVSQRFRKRTGQFRTIATGSGCCASPIILDLNGRGFDLTSAANGVKFDMAGTGTPIQMSWTAPGADNAFLALPGADGLVHNGQQLFGNFTPQPQSGTPNGFAALAVYDDPKNGGNGDGVIDFKDAIFASLRLWIDANHDGISQPEELHTLPSLGVNSISLKYKEDDRTDQYGNVFRYHAQVNPGDATSTGRIAYDVFFVGLAPTNTINAKNAGCQVPTNKVGMLAPVSSLR